MENGPNAEENLWINRQFPTFSKNPTGSMVVALPSSALKLEKKRFEQWPEPADRFGLTQNGPTAQLLGTDCKQSRQLGNTRDSR